MYFHFQQLSKQATTHLSFHPFSPYSAMQTLAAPRLILADFPTLVGVLAFQIEQRTSGEIGNKEYKHNCFFSCLLAPLIFFPPRLCILLTHAELGLRNFAILLVSLSTQPSD